MSLSSPSPSRFAKTPYCSVRDWTRFLRHRIKRYPDPPVHTLSDSLRIYFFHYEKRIIFSGFAVEFAEYAWTVAVSGKKKLRIRKYPDTCGRGLRPQKLWRLSKPQRQRQRQRQRLQTKDLMSKTTAVHVCYKSLYISLPSSAQ